MKFFKKGKKANGSSMTMIISALLVIWFIFTIITGGSYMTPRNISNLFRQTSITGILAIGMVFVIISGEIDLSVGSQMALIGGVAAILNVWLGFGIITTILISILFGIVLGMLSGLWVSYLNVPSFIVTLAGMQIFRGVIIKLTKGSTVSPITESFKVVGQSYLPPNIGYLIGFLLLIILSGITIIERNSKIEHDIEVSPISKEILKLGIIGAIIFLAVYILNSYAGIPVPVFLMLILLGIFSYVSKKTVFGRLVYSIGGNIEAAKYSGVNTKKIKLIIYIVNGILVAIAGILLTSRLGAGSVSAGNGAELDAIASCVIGGASLAGGSGTVIGAIFGALIMASLDNGMSMMGAGPSWQYMVKGGILLLAVYIDVRSKKKAQ